MTSTQINQLCQRINYRGPLDASVQVLNDVHSAWNHAVPFENFDIHLNRRIELTPSALFEKIAIRNRGGFCFEQNGLLADLLRSVGFNVTLCAAAVIGPTGELSPDFAHLCLLVEADAKKYVADIGFGEYSAHPLVFEPELVQGSAPEQYKIVADGDRFRSVRVNEIAGWPKGYSFSTTPRKLTDFTGMCDYMQSSPDSMFRKRRLCTRRRSNGRDTLADEKAHRHHARRENGNSVRQQRGLRGSVPRPFRPAVYGCRDLTPLVYPTRSDYNIVTISN
jgi:N-hydroxyarylamine O-acetyltransferase